MLSDRVSFLEQNFFDFQQSLSIPSIAQLLDSNLFKLFPKLQFMREDMTLLQNKMQELEDKVKFKEWAQEEEEELLGNDRLIVRELQ